MVLGLMIAMVGFDIISGDPRYAFGVPELMDGIDFLPVAIGLFGIGEVLAGAEESRRRALQGALRLARGHADGAGLGESRWAIARGTVLGFLVGILPGAGPTVSTFLSYASRRRSRSTRGVRRGAIEGVAGPSRPTTPPRPARWCRCSPSASPARRRPRSCSAG
jgi:putative tricarboxylic transport membrane protein